MTEPTPPQAASFPVRAIQLGERIDLRNLGRRDMVSANPAGFRTESGGFAFLFRFGAAVFFGVPAYEEEGLIASLADAISGPASAPETETADVQIRPETDDQVSMAGAIALKAYDVPRLLVVADALATSVALAHEENRLARAFEETRPLDPGIGQSPPRFKDLQRQISQALSLQHRMVGRVEVGEKPDILWDHPDLERLYARLEDEFELVERSKTLDRRIGLLRDTASTLSAQHQTRQSLRLELYIVLLIVFEICLTLYEMFVRGA